MAVILSKDQDVKIIQFSNHLSLYIGQNNSHPGVHTAVFDECR